MEGIEENRERLGGAGKLERRERACGAPAQRGKKKEVADIEAHYDVLQRRKVGKWPFRERGRTLY